MNPVGFVAVPRTELTSPAGAFFSAVVESKTGPGLWRVTLDGRTLVVQSDLDLTPGQTLRLKLVSQTAGKWLFQTIEKANTPTAVLSADPGLIAAFVSRGLPAAAERLSAWSRWLAKNGPSDKADWAASLEARGAGPDGPLASAAEPWLVWQTGLERGDNRPPPEDDPWDLWNARKPASDPWLVLPLRWEYEGQADAGLLQAHWSPVAQGIDRWNLTAAPAGVPFRLEAVSRTGRLDLVWRLFSDEDRRHWERSATDWERQLSSPELAVSLTVAGPAVSSGVHGGIDVQA
jgi:hypothetical protein